MSPSQGNHHKTFSIASLHLDTGQEVDRICTALSNGILHDLRRRGAIVGCSGGIDSSVVLALCARALGTERVRAVLLPERESNPESAELARGLATQLGVEVIIEDLTHALEGVGCYQRRDDAIRRVFAEFGPGWTSKIMLPGSLLEESTYNVFYLTVVSPEGTAFRRRLPPAEYEQIVAASNFKQRLRMSMLYYHAERRQYAVAGTANKNEHDLGFFVKYGDGGVDISPILHLFKSQVYQLAEYLGLPQPIRERVPTTDTYSAGSTQEEFFFRVPFETLDAVWVGLEHDLPSEQMAKALGLTVEQVERVIQDIRHKQVSTRYLRASALTA